MRNRYVTLVCLVKHRPIDAVDTSRLRKGVELLPVSPPPHLHPQRTGRAPASDLSVVMTQANPAPATAHSPEVSQRAQVTPDPSAEQLAASPSAKPANEASKKPDGPRESEPLKRIELRATEEFVAALDALAKKENSSKADIIRKGAGLYARMRMEQERGHLLGVVALEDGEIKVKEVIQL